MRGTRVPAIDFPQAGSDYGRESAYITRGAMVKIASVLARTVSIPLDRATSFARRQVTKRDYALVRIRTDDGLEGIGHCYAGHGAGSLVTEAVRQLLAPLLLGRDPHDSEALWAEMYQEGRLHGRAGAVR